MCFEVWLNCNWMVRLEENTVYPNSRHNACPRIPSLVTYNDAELTVRSRTIVQRSSGLTQHCCKVIKSQVTMPILKNQRLNFNSWSKDRDYYCSAAVNVTTGLGVHTIFARVGSLWVNFQANWFDAYSIQWKVLSCWQTWLRAGALHYHVLHAWLHANLLQPTLYTVTSKPGLGSASGTDRHILEVAHVSLPSTGELSAVQKYAVDIACRQQTITTHIICFFQSRWLFTLKGLSNEKTHHGMLTGFNTVGTHFGGSRFFWGDAMQISAHITSWVHHGIEPW